MWSHILVPGRDGAERAVCSRTAQSHFRMLVCSWVSSHHTGADAFAAPGAGDARSAPWHPASGGALVASSVSWTETLAWNSIPSKACGCSGLEFSLILDQARVFQQLGGFWSMASGSIFRGCSRAQAERGIAGKIRFLRMSLASQLSRLLSMHCRRVMLRRRCRRCTRHPLNFREGTQH